MKCRTCGANLPDPLANGDGKIEQMEIDHEEKTISFKIEVPMGCECGEDEELWTFDICMDLSEAETRKAYWDEEE